MMTLRTMTLALVAALGSVLGIASAVAAVAPQAQVQRLDKTGTTWGPGNEVGSQLLTEMAVASRVSFQAEGMGLTKWAFRKSRHGKRLTH